MITFRYMTKTTKYKGTRKERKKNLQTNRPINSEIVDTKNENRNHLQNNSYTAESNEAQSNAEAKIWLLFPDSGAPTSLRVFKGLFLGILDKFTNN